MRRVSMATRDELIAGLAKRYSEVGRMERSRILDEFVAVTGYHRKHAMRILRGGPTSSRCQPRPGRRVYGEEVRQAIILLWETSDRVCGKRLKALLPVLVEAMERHGRLKLDPVVREAQPFNDVVHGRDPAGYSRSKITWSLAPLVFDDERPLPISRPCSCPRPG